MSLFDKLTQRMALWHGIELSFIAVPAIVLVSKFVGLLREALLTKLLGLEASLDLFVIFTTVPTYAQAYIMGPFAVAFYASLATPGATAWPLARRLLPWLLGGGLIGGFIAFAAALVIAPRMNMTGVSGEAYATIALVCAATIPFAVLIGMAICLLHAMKSHTTAVMMSVVQPWIFVILLLCVDYLSGAALFEPVGLCYATSFLLAMGLCGYLALRKRDKAAGTELGDLRVFRGHLGYATLETAGFFGNQLLTMFFAGLSGVGGIAANGLAARVMLMPLTLLLTPLSPILQNIYRRGDPATRKRAFARAYAALLSAISLTMLGVVYFGEDVVRLFFQRGAFSADDTARVASMLLPYAVYVVCIAANHLCAAVAFVSGSGKNYTFTMLSNYALSNLLKIPMLSAYGLNGVIWAAAMAEGAAAVVNTWRQFTWREASAS